MSLWCHCDGAQGRFRNAAVAGETGFNQVLTWKHLNFRFVKDTKTSSESPSRNINCLFSFTCVRWPRCSHLYSAIRVSSGWRADVPFKAVPVPLYPGVHVNVFLALVTEKVPVPGESVPVQVSQCWSRWVTAVPGESLLVQGQLNEDNGSKLFTELLQDDDSSQQGQVFQSEDTCTDKLR